MTVLATYIDMKSVEKPADVTYPIESKPFIEYKSVSQCILMLIIVLDALYVVYEPGVNPNVSYSSIVLDISFFIVGIIVHSPSIQIVHLAHKLNNFVWYVINTAHRFHYSVDTISTCVLYVTVYFAFSIITLTLIMEEEERSTIKKENKSTITDNKKRDNSVFVINLKHI